mmetsp:Transcript_55728/g.64343  ORF Transcript_55728/g.64343 Transcript_55728/m.64343 type:complete len:134 (+) Transcript_55728:720-1121(+)
MLLTYIIARYETAKRLEEEEGSSQHPSIALSSPASVFGGSILTSITTVLHPWREDDSSNGIIELLVVVLDSVDVEEDVRLAPTTDDRRGWSGYYLYSHVVDHHHSSCQRRCREGVVTTLLEEERRHWIMVAWH